MTTLTNKPQTVQRILANEMFALALKHELDKYKGVLDFEYTTDGVPETGKAIHAMYKAAQARTAPFKVFSGANASELLFFTPSTNLAYRTLHDLDHAQQYDKGRGTTKEADELYLNCLMAKRVYTYATNSGMYSEAEALMAFFCVYHDTVGQVRYYVQNKDFCTDQKANTEKLLEECAGMQALREGGLVLARCVMVGYLNACGVHWSDV